MVPAQKYDVIHYIREAYPEAAQPDAVRPGRSTPTSRSCRRGRRRGPDAAGRPSRGSTMDYGPSLIGDVRGRRRRDEHRLQGDRRPARRRARRGVARAGRGRSTSTTRCGSPRRGPARGSSTGTGSTSTASTRSTRGSSASSQFANPAGPGWANPETGTFDDPRLAGPRRPALRPASRESWAHYRGLYHARRPGRPVVHGRRHGRCSKAPAWAGTEHRPGLHAHLQPRPADAATWS